MDFSKYIVVQTFSGVFILPIMLFYNDYYFYILLLIFFKLGLFPFYQWFLDISSRIKYEYLYLFLVVQKIPPLLILVVYSNDLFLIFLACINMLFSSLKLLGSNILFEVLFFSSLNSAGFFIVCGVVRIEYRFFYLFLTLLRVIIPLIILGVDEDNKNLIVFWVLVVERGAPPFTFFFLKLAILNILFLGLRYEFLVFLIFLMALNIVGIIKYILAKLIGKIKILGLLNFKDLKNPA